MSEVNCFVVGIVKALKEGNKISHHFGSTASLNHYIDEAKELGFIDEHNNLTEKAHLFYDEHNIQSLSNGRSYFWDKIWNKQK